MQIQARPWGTSFWHAWDRSQPRSCGGALSTESRGVSWNSSSGRRSMAAAPGYVADDKIYCVYIAADAEQVREHARRGGFPADIVAEVRSVIDPTAAE